nr:hypothetical protein [uncultured Rhodoferax sp.]
MSILIAVIACVLVAGGVLGIEWNGSEENLLLALISVIVALFLVLFCLPSLQEFGRSEASRDKVRRFRSKGRALALGFSLASGVMAVGAVVWLREEPRKPAPTRTQMAPVAAPSVPFTQPDAAALRAADAGDDGIRAFVTVWARDWSDGDAQRYLAAYSPAFVPSDGVARKTWEAQRRQRVDKGRGIVVKVTDLQVTAQAGGRATANFLQQYSARGLTDVSRKTLQLERLDGAWRITREAAVAIAAAD